MHFLETRLIQTSLLVNLIKVLDTWPKLKNFLGKTLICDSVKDGKDTIDLKKDSIKSN